MYEYLKPVGGLGWSDYLVDGEYQQCGQVVGGIKKCFTATSADETCARNSNCFQLADRCTTTSGGSGFAWCCPRHLPPPPGMPCLPQPVEMVCHRHETRCSTFPNDAEYATCRIQKALCDLGVDPGPVDGRGTSDMYRIAIRMFKSRRGLTPADDNPRRSSFLEELGLDKDPRVVRGAAPPGGGGSRALASWFWPAAFGLSTVFLGAAWWRYGGAR